MEIISNEDCGVQDKAHTASAYRIWQDWSCLSGKVGDREMRMINGAVQSPKYQLLLGDDSLRVCSNIVLVDLMVTKPRRAYSPGLLQPFQKLEKDYKESRTILYSSSSSSSSLVAFNHGAFFQGFFMASSSSL